MKKLMLVIAILAIIAPWSAKAYGGGFPPIFGIGPRLEQSQDRLAAFKTKVVERMEVIRDRLSHLRWWYARS